MGGIVTEAALTRFVGAVLERLGVPDSDAVLVAATLVEADLRGVESHGVVRFPIYVERIAAGAVNPRPKVRVLRESATSAVVDGDNGLGHLVGVRAMEVAIEKGRAGACAFVAVRNSNHFGTASHFAEMALAGDMIGLSLTIGGINHMVPWGGAEPILGNNPFAVAIPAGDEQPVTLDMACSVAARGKIIVAAKDGTPIPPDWAVGPDGRPTTDPVEALKGFVQPVGGAKGYALTLTIGLLSTMLSGAFFGAEVTHLYENLERAQNVGHLFGVIPVALFEDLAHFRARMDRAIREVRGVRRATGVERIYLPGERERLLMAERKRAGIPLGAAILAELDAVGARYGVALERH
jgi:LDH2 family malate/lactate/ureidoglycolate dehydrogenase